MKQNTFELVVFILLTLIIEIALIDLFIIQQSAMALFVLIAITTLMIMPLWITIIRFGIKEYKRNRED
jgi:membrane protein YdbS with pleckstrin-like domain